MRKILLSFLMLIMLTPSLACAMPVCAAPAAAAQAQCAAKHKGMAHNINAGEDHSGMNHNAHAGKDHHAGKQEKQSSSGMLMKDCMGVELQKADNSPSIHKPDLSKDAPAILAFNVQPVSVWTLDDVRGIRGPPPDWPSYSQTQPSIILTTQRLRI